MMQMLQGTHYFELIDEVFKSVTGPQGFEIRKENEKLFIARKGDLELLFRLEVGYQAYYFSLEIRLLGRLGERATTDSHYRHLGVTAIAKCYDPNHKMSAEAADTTEKLQKMMETQKEELLKYCADILAGDVSSWSRIVDCLMKKGAEAKHKTHEV